MGPDQEHIAVQRKVRETFFPYATRKQDSAHNARFSHYTSAENAIRIIESQTVWLRNALVMNDFAEVQHGHACIDGALRNEAISARVKSLLNGVSPGLAEKVIQGYYETHELRARDTYIISISEHGNAEGREDLYGRLSMWRAYGGSTNVAFVFNSRPFLAKSDALQAYTSPVLYADQEIFEAEFAKILDGIEGNMDFVRALGAGAVNHLLSSALHFAALSTKHPGFWEEREWRVLFNPSISVTGKFSNKITGEIATVGGVPQKIFKLKMENYPLEGHLGATLPELLEEIIIGPTQFPWPIFSALYERLTAAGVKDAENRIKVSNIPLRR